MLEDQFGDYDCLYQHDNAPCHKSGSVKEWFAEMNVPEMDWLAQIPDLNPTEHLWDELECDFAQNPKAPLPWLELCRRNGLPFRRRRSDTW
jgi:hypothetical protein